MAAVQITPGMRFGKWTVIGNLRVERSGKRRLTVAPCRCECGAEVLVRRVNLLSGTSTKCKRCQYRYTTAGSNHGPTKHGHSKSKGGHWRSRTYSSWCAMMERCYRESCCQYANYGGRGITVCERWQGGHGFENFLADMGERPLRTTIDRFPDNDGNYKPGNCRWATARQQNKNKRNNTLLTWNGKTQCLSAWSEETGINVSILIWRIKRWPLGKAMTQPVEERRPFRKRKAAS